MISIIVCTRNLNDFQALKESIAQTIACPYEIISIHNEANQHSIFSAYNMGAAQSHGDLLCFVHEDVRFISPNWGPVALSYFSESQAIGAVGVAGSAFHPGLPTGWFATGLNSIYIKLFLPAKSSSPWVLSNQNYPSHCTNILQQVVTLDGVLLMIPKAVFSQVSFDQATFGGFHGYDIDISLQIHEAGYKLFVTHEILIEHASTGSMNKQWIENAFLLFNKWQTRLPAMATPIPRADQIQATAASLVITAYLLLTNKVNIRFFAKFLSICVRKSNRNALFSFALLRTAMSLLLRRLKQFF